MKTVIPERRDETGKIYPVDVEDSSLTLAELASGAVGAIICSWATRVRRDDLLSFQIDGTHGSAVAGLHRCWIQSRADTPTVQHFNPDRDLGIDYRANWNEVSDQGNHTNPYRVRLGTFPSACRRWLTACERFDGRNPRCPAGRSLL